MDRFGASRYYQLRERGVKVKWGNIMNRLREPSTWAGLAVLAGLFGVPLLPEQLAAIGQAGAALAGVAAVFMQEKAS